MKNTKKGFTLIELLVVIAIIGILSSIVLVSLSTARSKGKDAAIQGELSQLRAAAEIFAQDNGNSYNNMFTSNNTWASTNGNIQAILTGITSAGASVKTAGSAAGAWAAQAQSIANTANYFCVDSTGVSKTGTAALAAGGTVCP